MPIIHRYSRRLFAVVLFGVAISKASVLHAQEAAAIGYTVARYDVLRGQ